MNNVGWLYQYGLGVEQNDATARKWYEKAAAAGSHTGKGNLARLLDAKRGGLADSPKTARLLLCAAKDGNTVRAKQLRGDMKLWTEDTRKNLKTELRRLGHYKDKIDSEWNDAARAAFEAYLKGSNRPQSCAP